MPKPHAPSDSHAAAGLTNFIVTTNNDIGVYRKLDCVQTNFAPLAKFFKPAGANDATQTLSDARVLFDRATNRYFVTADGRDSSDKNKFQFQYFAVSQDCVSQDCTGGSWWLYQIILSLGPNPHKLFCKETATVDWDYPQAGNNIDRWFIAANTAVGNILSIDKATSRAGADTTVACFPGLQLNIAPPIVLDSDPGAVFISPGSFSGSAIKRYRINTSAGSPATDTLSELGDVSIPQWTAALGARQPNGEKLNTQEDGRFQSASMQDSGEMINIHTVSLFADRSDYGFSKITLYAFSTAPDPTSAVSREFDPPGFCCLFNPSVTSPGVNGAVFVTASQTMPLGIGNAGNAAHVVFSTADELGIVNSNWTKEVIATSTVQYEDCHAQPENAEHEHVCPWGDYSATTFDPDPLHPNRAWSINQIATGTSFRNWATTTGAVDVTPPTSPVSSTSPVRARNTGWLPR